MSRHVVLMKCIGFVDIADADSAEEAMEMAEKCGVDQIRDISGFFPETAIAIDDMPALAKHISKQRRRYSAVGRPRTTKDDIPCAFIEFYDRYKNGKISIANLARLCGVSRPTVYKYIRLLEGDKNEDEE